jgi:hypothetical protein
MTMTVTRPSTRKSRAGTPSSAEVDAAASTLGLPTIPLPAAVARAAVDAARLTRDRAETENLAWEIREERLPAAREEDRTNLAASLRAGAPDADPSATLRAQSDLAAADRRAEALVIAESAARDDLTAAIDAERDAWLPDLEASVATATARYHAAMVELRASHEALSDTVGAERWLRDPSSNPKDIRYLTTIGQQDQYGHPLTVADVITTLASLTETS